MRVNKPSEPMNLIFYMYLCVRTRVCVSVWLELQVPKIVCMYFPSREVCRYLDDTHPMHHVHSGCGK